MALKFISCVLSLLLATQLVDTFPAQTINKVEQQNAEINAKELVVAKKAEGVKATEQSIGYDETKNSKSSETENEEVIVLNEVTILDVAKQTDGTMNCNETNVDCIKLFLLAEIQISNIVKMYLKDAIILLIIVIEDDFNLENANKMEKLNEHLHEFHEFMKEVNQTLTNSNINGNKINVTNLVTELSRLIARYNSTIVEDISANEWEIDDLLLKNGNEAFENTYYESFANFVRNLLRAVESYIERVTEIEQNDDDKLIDWYEDFRQDDDVMQQNI